MRKRLIYSVLLAGSLTLLAGCQSDEERAEEHFQTALELIEDGDFDRAQVEFRNVFQLNGSHEDARLVYAEMQRDRGFLGEAYGQYLRLVEQHPDNFEGRISVAELAIENGNWPEAIRHGEAASELQPGNPRVRAVLAAIAYYEAAQGSDTGARAEAFDMAQAVVADAPDNYFAQQVVVDYLVTTEQWDVALAAIDVALGATEDAMDFHYARLNVLYELGDMPAVADELRTMVTLFPEDDEIRTSLLQWYVSEGDYAAAEAFLRDRLDTLPAGEERAATEVLLVDFLAAYRGPTVALDEVERLLTDETEGAAAIALTSTRAEILFQEGRPDEAVAALRDLLGDGEPSPETNPARFLLAEALVNLGELDAAREEVASVLSIERSNVEAIKLRAGWQIADGDTGNAITILRSALAEQPNDPELMTLLARAHMVDGNGPLQAEMLSLAVSAAGNAPEESLRYARYRQSTGRLDLAETILLDAAEYYPEDTEVQAALAELYMDLGRDSRALITIDTLGGLPGGDGPANELTTTVLAAQGLPEDILPVIQSLTTDDAEVDALFDRVRGLIAQQSWNPALQRLTLTREPAADGPDARIGRGVVLALSGETAAAADEFWAALGTAPGDVRAWAALYTLARAGTGSDPQQILDEARAAVEDPSFLLWIAADVLYADGDRAGAIAAYEELAALMPRNPVVANNLVTVLTSGEPTEAELVRARDLATRLRGWNNPVFQDTYGWAAFLVGEYDTALNALVPAAASLPEDTEIAYHLAKTYSAMGRYDDALTAYESLARSGPSEEHAEEVATEIARLRDELEAEAEDTAETESEN